MASSGFNCQPGLCVEGVCDTPGCPANGAMVIYNAGFGHFDLTADAAECKCPMCQQPFEPAACAFNRCEWAFRGTKQTATGDSAPQPVFAGWRAAGNKFERFDEREGNLAAWSRLLLLTRRVGTDRRRSSQHSEGAECPICCRAVDPALACAVGGCCKHAFHHACLAAWKARGAAGRAGCPVCAARSAV